MKDDSVTKEFNESKDSNECGLYHDADEHAASAGHRLLGTFPSAGSEEPSWEFSPK